MHRLVALSLLTLPLLVCAGPAADDKPVALGGEKKLAPASHPVMVRLGDGSSVKVSLTQSHVEVTTKFGKLSIPANEIRNIDFALRYPPGVAERLAAAATHLGSDDFKQREDAAADLLALQELAYPTLEKLTKNKDKEIARRAEELLVTLREKIPEEKLKFATKDSLVTDTFTVVGWIEGSSFSAKSSYFGQVTLNLADLKNLRRASSEGADQEFVLDLAKHGVPQRVWLNTGIEVRRDTVLEIRAVGESDLYPIGAELGAYKTTPTGSRQWGPSRDQKTPGQLLGRIGERGKEFEIGERYDGSPGVEGKLYLRVASSPWNVVPAGEYRVKIAQR